MIVILTSSYYIGRLALAFLMIRWSYNFTAKRLIVISLCSMIASSLVILTVKGNIKLISLSLFFFGLFSPIDIIIRYYTLEQGTAKFNAKGFNVVNASLLLGETITPLLLRSGFPFSNIATYTDISMMITPASLVSGLSIISLVLTLVIFS